MHYYQHNIGDYARDTGHLSVLEHGIYRLILDWCYLNEKPITTEQAMRVGRGNPTETQSVLSEFFLQTPDGWTHKRVVAEIDSYHSKARRNRENGLKGGRPKPTDNRVGSQVDAKHNPNQEPLTTNHKPINTNIPSSSVVIGTPVLSRGDDEKPSNPAEWIEVFAEQHGVDLDHRSFHDRKKFWPLATAWTAAGVTVGQMRQACAKAFATATEPIAWLPAYADRVLAGMQAPPRPPGKSFAQSDREAGMQRWEQMTGREHPDRSPAARQTIDITPSITSTGAHHELAIQGR